MKRILSLAMLSMIGCTAIGAEISLETAPPVIVKTAPEAGATNVAASLSEIRVTYSKAMADGAWSWSTWAKESYPQTVGDPKYLGDHRTCVLPVKLQPGRFYAIWLNSDRFKNFQDVGGRPAVPYLLTFATAGAGAEEHAEAPAGARTDDKLLNEEQRAVADWTTRKFRAFLDARTFTQMPENERQVLETRMMETLKGPISIDYYQAINTLGALRSTNALPALRALAFDRQDKDNRDRWMAIRALGLTGDRTAVPELAHLVYHGNSNTRWWAQISLVRITGENFGSDWRAWGKWWNQSDGQPPFKGEIIRWWKGQAEDEKLAASLQESDKKFLEGIAVK